MELPEGKILLAFGQHPLCRRLIIFDPEGAVWNIPCWQCGSLKVRLRMPKGSQGMQICLVDRWFNPVDPVLFW